MLEYYDWEPGEAVEYTPRRVAIPVKMHIGAPSQPLVAVVDGEVLREQRYHIRLSDKKVNFFYPQGLSYQPRMEEAN